MTQSRGSNKVKVLAVSPLGVPSTDYTSIKHALEKYFSGYEPPLEDDFFNRLACEVFSQHSFTKFGTFAFRSNDEHSKRKEKVVKAAKQLQKKLDHLLELEVGPDVLTPWELDFYKDVGQPLIVFRKMLAALENFDENYLYKSNISQIYRSFISNVSSIFKESGLSIEIGPEKILVLFLTDLDASLPGTAFPKKTVSSARLDYIRKSLENCE
jgi:hypothetical protein